MTDLIYKKNDEIYLHWSLLILSLIIIIIYICSNNLYISKEEGFNIIRSDRNFNS